MIQTGIESRVKIQDIIVNQLPEYILDESPKAVDFLKQYYISQEYQGAPVDIVDNLDQYLKVDNLTPEVVVGFTTLTSQVNLPTTNEVTGLENPTSAIYVDSTKGFPDRYGLLKIDDEIITYTEKTPTSFVNCFRGFSGITSYHADLNEEELVFSSSSSSTHEVGSNVHNLSALFLREFYKKLKYTFAPGFEEKEFASSIDAGNFIKNARSFYSSKGTDESIRILFGVLYGEKPKVINLEDYLLKPSDAQFIRREVAVAEAISGNPTKLVGQTLYKSNDSENTKASVSAVEAFTRNGKEYFKISLFVGYDDQNTVEGTFEITPCTKSLELVNPGSSVIFVDSTIGFPKSGTLKSGSNTIAYTNRTVNQFLGCSGINVAINPTDNVFSDKTYFGYEDGNTDNIVEVRLTGVISDFINVSGYIETNEDQLLTIKSIGDKIENPEQDKTYKQIFANSWIYNTSSSIDIESVTSSSVQLKDVVDRSQLKVGDYIEIVDKLSNVIVYPTDGSQKPYVSSNISLGSKNIALSGFSTSFYNSGIPYALRRKINKSYSSSVSFEYGNRTLISDVQNVYTDTNYAYVSSNSLPSGFEFETVSQENFFSSKYIYNIDQNLNLLTNINSIINGDTIAFNILSGSNPFITGQRIYYYPESTPIVGLETGSYYVKVLSDDKQIKLFRSSSSIVNDSNAISISQPSGGFGSDQFVSYTQKSRKIGSGKTLKKFPLSQNIDTGNNEETIPGSIGMLINGVEILNYKSPDKIYYGPIEKVTVLNGGENYDVVNPPKIELPVGLGITALLQPVVSGTITDIIVDTQNFDIDKVLSVTVTGGNISGGSFQTVLEKRRRELVFDARATTSGGGISTTTNQITFTSDHNLTNGQELIYENNGYPSISIGIGLSTLQHNSSYFVKVDNNTSVTLYETYNDYLNNTNSIGFSTDSLGGIQKFLTAEKKNTISQVKITDGGKVTNRKLLVKSSGISTTTNLISFINHGFSSGEIVEYSNTSTSISGISTLNQYYILKNDHNSFRLCDAGIGGTITSNYEQEKYVTLNSQGSGFHLFKYPDIQATVEFVSVGLGTTTQSQVVTATPVVKGSIVDLYLYETGTGYGSSVLNFEKKPPFTIKTGRDARIEPIIVNGSVIDVNVDINGYEYFSVPDLVLSDPTGKGVGAKFRAVVTNQSITDVEIVNPGIGYSTSSQIDVISSGKNAVFDLNIRSLNINEVERSNEEKYETFVDNEDNLQYFVLGLSEDLQTSLQDDSSSPKIIGWAYDGNPIYGSYGFNENSGISTIRSSYTKDFSNIFDRPSGFELGFFVDDYVFNGSGDLDEHNGRFAKTNEFPNGVYAYHAIIDQSTNKPKFPYFIGNSFRSKSLDENKSLDQEFDFVNSDLNRNTFPYKISELYSDNDFIIETNEIRRQKIIVDSVESGSLTGFTINEPGDNYKVGDKLTFSTNQDYEGSSSAQISEIKGKTITNLSTSYESFEDSVFVWYNNKVRVYINPSHNLYDQDYVTISGFSTSKLSKLNNTFKINVNETNPIGLTTEIVSGISTAEIYVTNVPGSVSSGSTIGIGTEFVEILNVFPNKNVLKVKRSIPGIAHSISESITIPSNYFDIDIDVDYFESKVNSKVYFNPIKHVGFGTIVGESTQSSFAFGDEIITIDVPTQRIYLENHPFKTNQKLTHTPSGSSILYSNTPTGITYSLPTTVYAVNKSPNTIGIKTSLSSDEIFFRGGGSYTDDYLFESNYKQSLGKVEKIKSTVSVSTYHGLTEGDLITLTVEPNLSVGVGTSTKINVLYKPEIASLILNPITFDWTGVSTSTNEITISNHGFKTGDKVYYESNDSGISTGSYYVYKVNNSKFKLSETYKNITSNPPTTVSFASTGGSSQVIYPINPQVEVTKNNSVVFDLSDSSLSGYDFKVYYDNEFNNNFASSGLSTEFTVSGVGTVGVSSIATLTLSYDASTPQKLYYTLENSGGYISTADKTVRNYSEILFVDSLYHNSYPIQNIDSTSFTINLRNNPEKQSYSSSECDTLKYTTSSTSAQGPVEKIKLISGGYGYKVLPIVSGTTSVNGKNLYAVPTSSNIGNIKQTRIVNQGFEYSSDKTLQPRAFISPKITLTNTNTISNIDILYGGKDYINQPQIVVVNSDSREVIDNGLLIPTIVGSSISKIDIEVEPKGISDASAEIFTVNNTNGVSIKQVESSNSGIFTCIITTPPTGFSEDPFKIGDEVFIEGIQKYSSDGNGFNSSDYGYRFFTVTNYSVISGSDDRVTVSVEEFTTNTGIAKTIQDSSGTIVNKSNYPVFDITLKLSTFNVGEKLISNDIERDLEVVLHNTESFKVFGTYELSEGEKITGKSSGNSATISALTKYDGRFAVSYSSPKNEGWKTEIGKLNEDYQVLPNNDYYQNMSYSVKSNQTWDTIRTPVNNLIHPVGMKNFSDTEITTSNESGIKTSTNNTIVIKDIIDEKRVDTINNFDFVRDIDVIQGASRFLEFENKSLTNYTEIGSNIVLRIDDISGEFNSFESDPNQYLDIISLNSTTEYENYLFRIRNLNNQEIQLTNVTLIRDTVNNNSFILNQENLVNVGSGLTHTTDELYGEFSIEFNEIGDEYLRFTPKDPFDSEYDIKYVNKKFISGSGIGSTSIGDINILSNIVGVSTGGITTSLVTFNSNKISSFYAINHVIEEVTNQMNIVELYVTHDGTNTNISEYYFDNGIELRSGNFIGSFGANINSGILSLNYTNDRSRDVNVKTKIVGFGTFVNGIGTYRFKAENQPDGSERSVIYQSGFSTTSSGISTSVIKLNKNIFDSIHSLIEVSIGSTKSLHQVSLVQDITNIYTQQSLIITIEDQYDSEYSATAGLGTFGGEYFGSNEFGLVFYPNSSINSDVTITSFNECLYTDLDTTNEYSDLNLNTSIETVGYSQYFAINGDRINTDNFVLRNNGIPIFAKTFDPNSSSLNAVTGVFNIPNHFFSNNEELIYTPESSFIGVGKSALVYANGAVSGYLPSSVFVVNKTDDTFQISTTRSGTAVTFTDLGEGNAHQLSMFKRNEKCIITLNNLVQYPLIYTKNNSTLSGNGGGISTSSSIFSLSGISTINPLDILKINDEYLQVINVGLGTVNIGPITNNGSINLVEVERSFVGSSITSHTDGDSVEIYKGSYNIVGDRIYFTKAPRGNIGITRDDNNLKFETSDFTGRVFLRKTYDTNQIYDDISQEFTGIGRTFNLTVGGANTTGIGETGGNGVVFLNGIFQTPTTQNNPNNNFNISDDGVSGITTIIFSGIRTDSGDPNSVLAVENDINQNQVPRGGIIVSLGSSGGLGYAPPVGASVTAIISGNSIIGISTNKVGGSYGSGYNGLVSIAVTAYEVGHAGAAASIRATVGVGGTLIFDVVTGGSGYNNPEIMISEPSYSNLPVTGVFRLGIGNTTTTGVGLLVDVEVGASSTTGIGSTYFEVSSFSISRSGYSFKKGDVFTPVGLVTDGRLSSPLSEFRLTVLETFSDNFGAWQFGELDFIDSLKNYQDGVRVRFPLYYNGDLLSFELQNEENEINLANSLLVIINGIIQDPGVSYTFNGGTSFTFTTAPKVEDDIAVFFYRGTRGEDDTLITNIIPTLERGDTVQVFKNNAISGTDTQDPRVIFDLSKSDVVETNPYFNEGIDEVNPKPLSWTKQKTDRYVNGEFVYKTRKSLISQVYPSSKVIGDISTSDTEFFVEDTTLFGYDIDTSGLYSFDAILVSGVEDASAPQITASVGTGGTITSLTIADGGSGFTGSTVEIKFMAPPEVGVGVGTTASATATVGATGTLTTPITITNPGFGYSTNPTPYVIVPLPNPVYEEVKIENIKGFSGYIAGIGETVNGGQPAIKFTLKRTPDEDGIFPDFNVSPNLLSVGYPIVIKNTQIGSGTTSVISSDSETVGVGTSFLDNIYYVNDLSVDGSVGVITCNVHSGSPITGLSSTGYNIGQFSWGLFGTITRSSNPISIGVTGNTFNIGLTTFPTIQRRSEGLRQLGALIETLD